MFFFLSFFLFLRKHVVSLCKLCVCARETSEISMTQVEHMPARRPSPTDKTHDSQNKMKTGNMRNLLELDSGDLGDLMSGNLAPFSSSRSMLPFSASLRWFSSNLSIFFDNSLVSMTFIWSSTFWLFIWNSMELWLIALCCSIGRLLSHISALGSIFMFETIFVWLYIRVMLFILHSITLGFAFQIIDNWWMNSRAIWVFRMANGNWWVISAWRTRTPHLMNGNCYYFFLLSLFASFNFFIIFFAPNSLASAVCLFAAFRCWENCYRLFWGDSSTLTHAQTRSRSQIRFQVLFSMNTETHLSHDSYLFFRVNHARGHFVVVMRCDAIVGGLHSMVALLFAVFLRIRLLLFLVTLSVSDFIWQSDVIECVKNTLSSHLIDIFFFSSSA